MELQSIPGTLSAGVRDVGIVLKKSEFSTNGHNLPDCLCHSLPGWREQVKNSLACAAPGQSSSAGQGGSTFRALPTAWDQSPHGAQKSKVFLQREKERAELRLQPHPSGTSALLWEGTAWLLLLCCSHTSCGRCWHCPVVLGTSLLKLSRGLDPSRLFRGLLRASSMGPRALWHLQDMAAVGLESEDAGQPQTKALEQ